MECGGKRSATPLSLTFGTAGGIQSGVALRLPPHSKGFASFGRAD
jgi:hypothetical protein